MTDRYGYIGIETLLNYCQNSKDYSITPNDFMRMQRIQIPILCEKCGVWDSKGAKHDEPRPHGEWIKKEGIIYLYECSVCGEIARHEWRSKFCPNCGARMKEGDEE